MACAVADALACGVIPLVSDKVNIAPDVAADGAGLMETDTVEGTVRLLERFQSLCDEELATMRRRALDCYNERAMPLKGAAAGSVSSAGIGIIKNKGGHLQSKDGQDDQLRRHIPALDGVRGCVPPRRVFIYHYGGGAQFSLLPLRLIGKAIHFGWAGVSLFFVLSGFLISGILWDSYHKPGWWRRFNVGRSLRIFPLYYLAIVSSLSCLSTPTKAPSCVSRSASAIEAHIGK